MNIDILGNRFIGMFKEQTENGIALRMEVDFSSNYKDLKWSVFSETNDDNLRETRIMVIPKNDKSGNHIYHVIGMEGIITFDDLIEHSKKIIDFNMEVEEKKILLKERITELGELFAKHTIEKLRDLKFIFSSNSICSVSPTPTKPGKRPKKEKKMPVATQVQEIKEDESEPKCVTLQQ